MLTENKAPVGSRPRGRPRLPIDRDAVADAVAELFVEGGYDAVTIADTADKLAVSRATLYRTVPTKEDLLGILFERSMQELIDSAKGAIDEVEDSAERLRQLIGIHTGAAVQMRKYMPVFFGGGDLPPEVYSRWHRWTRPYEKIWRSVVTDNIREGNLAAGDPVVTMRLILGMVIWISRWYRPNEKITADQIASTAIQLLRLDQVGADQRRPEAVTSNRRPPRTAPGEATG
ncbi:TetR/AcrR family transcriptional regulator [Mycolicibacterium moriokaense]|nr:TetR/AcrR family transcriptional regulator [Mycolicibacterium moriokaense]